MPSDDSSRSELLLAWAADVLAVLYLWWNYRILARHTAAFGAIIQNLGADVPRSTALVLAHHAWLYPALFGGTLVLVVAKEHWIRDKRLSVAVTFLLALAVLWVSDYIKAALLFPLLDVIEKLA